MNELKWISSAIATAIHDEAIYEFGGLAGFRDAGLLESACVFHAKCEVGGHAQQVAFQVRATGIFQSIEGFSVRLTSHNPE